MNPVLHVVAWLALGWLALAAAVAVLWAATGHAHNCREPRR